MAVQVKMFMTLVPLSKSKRGQYEVDWRPGLTPKDLLDAEEFSSDDQDAIAVVVNSEQALPDRELQDGDRVDLLVNLQGG